VTYNGRAAKKTDFLLMKNATKYTIFLYLKEKEGEKTMRSERDFFLSKYYAYLWISF